MLEPVGTPLLSGTYSSRPRQGIDMGRLDELEFRFLRIQQTVIVCSNRGHHAPANGTRRDADVETQTICD